MKLTPAGHRAFPFHLAAVVLLALFVAACSSDGEAEPSREASPEQPSAAPSDEAGQASDAIAPASRDAPTPLPRSGPARPYALGFTATPAVLTPDAYVDVFDEAALRADVIMIQRPVAWTEVRPGGSISPSTRATIEWERQLIADRGLDLLFAIDPWQAANRGRLAGEAPGEGFRDASVTRDYVAYAEFVVREYRPRWLALAVDLDAVARSRPEDLDAIEAAYRRAYAAVKAIAPETRIFATFQLEDLQGLLPWSTHTPQWSLLLRFDDVLDVLAVSSFPSLIFPFASDIPDTYYSRLDAFQKPVALVPSGFASAPGRNGVTFGTVRGQQQFLRRVLAEAEAGAWELVVWISPDDPAFATEPPFDLFAQMGMRAAGGVEKPAWSVWVQSAIRPWQPAPAEGAGAATD
ncbi:MAG: hypothetical protein DK306_001024 [Chloroflexi bacterium]|nr:MAG: hypothetical protein DK306_001024 [Chloroflexota bacterium]